MWITLVAMSFPCVKLIRKLITIMPARAHWLSLTRLRPNVRTTTHVTAYDKSRWCAAGFT